MSLSADRIARAARKQHLNFPRLWWTAGWILLFGMIIGCLEPPRYVPDLHMSDKLEHAGAYFLLTFWFGGLLVRRSYPLMALGMLVLGALIEVAQGAMGWGRTEDFWDFAADAAGICAALMLVYAGMGSWLVQVERLVGLSREPT